MMSKFFQYQNFLDIVEKFAVGQLPGVLAITCTNENGICNFPHKNIM